MKRLWPLAFFGLVFALAACNGGGSSSQAQLIPAPHTLPNGSVNATPTTAPYYTMYLTGNAGASQTGQIQEFSTQQLTTGDAPTNPMRVVTDGTGNAQVTGLVVGPA